MRKKLKPGLVILFVILLGFLGIQFYSTLQEKQQQSNIIAYLPCFSLLNTESKMITQEDITKGKWTIFVFFNSECHYCQEEANQLAQLKNDLENIQFYWISSEEMNRIKEFRENYRLMEGTNIVFLQDINHQLAENWNITSTPQFLVYNAEGALIKNHKGAWRMDNLLKTILHGFKEN